MPWASVRPLSGRCRQRIETQNGVARGRQAPIDIVGMPRHPGLARVQHRLGDAQPDRPSRLDEGDDGEDLPIIQRTLESRHIGDGVGRRRSKPAVLVNERFLRRHAAKYGRSRHAPAPVCRRIDRRSATMAVLATPDCDRGRCATRPQLSLRQRRPAGRKPGGDTRARVGSSRRPPRDQVTTAAAHG
jgi:hypothetical protein